MNRESSPASSDETTATSIPSHGGFICTVCFKVCRNGQALGGHQNAHIFERSSRQTTPNILGAVLNHPLPEDDVQVLASNLAGSNSGIRNHHPPTPLQEQQMPAPGRLNAQEDGPKTTTVRRGNGGDRHYHPHESRVRYRSSHYHPYERPSAAGGGGGNGGSASSDESHRGRLTQNLLSEWKPMYPEMKGDTMDDPDVDLELSLKRMEYIDLTLKLGF